MDGCPFFIDSDIDSHDLMIAFDFTGFQLMFMSL